MVEFNLGLVHERISAAVPDHECVVWRDRRLTYADITDRSRRLATFLHRAGLGTRTERSTLEGHESGQDHVALYLYNGNEYVEGMLGAYKARVVPFNVNYRYVDAELRFLFADARTRGFIFHATFAPVLDRILPDLPEIELLLQVADESGNALLPGAVDYEEALVSCSAELPLVSPSPDDLYVIYTGGTTGMPKGVLWRQHDIFMAAMGGRTLGTSEIVSTYDEVADRVRRGQGLRTLLLPPFMHAASQWVSFITMAAGGTLVMQHDTHRLDPVDVWETVARERVQMMPVVGDAVVRPLVEELERGGHDTSSLVAIGNGGARLNPALKERLLSSLPQLILTDSAGASETGAQMTQVANRDEVSSGRFVPYAGAVVVSEELDRVHEPGHAGLGWLAQSGNVPLGYLGDAPRTARTFPVIAGVRYAVPGDRARLLSNGEIELLGRDAVTINSGGEKIFAEEVEQAIAQHPHVDDVVVVGRASDRWGEEVVALVVLRDGATVSDAEIVDAASAHVARYKLPKAVIRLGELHRSPVGKADYRWARDEATRHPS